MRSFTNFQTDLLRSFVSVVDLGAFTKAGDALGRTQPAISLQIKRLEELVGAPIIRQVGRALLLTGHSGAGIAWRTLAKRSSRTGGKPSVRGKRADVTMTIYSL